MTTWYSVLAGQAAAQARDIALAARCWRKALSLRPEAWMEVVGAAATLMTPEQILDQVLPPGGRLPFLLAEQVYTTPEWRETREKYLRACIKRVPNDTDMSSAERLWLESQARALLGERDLARNLMSESMLADSHHPEWRERFVDWLLAWGEVEEASRQARIGLTLHPDHPGIQRAAKAAIDAFAHGDAKTKGPN